MNLIHMRTYIFNSNLDTVIIIQFFVEINNIAFIISFRRTIGINNNFQLTRSNFEK